MKFLKRDISLQIGEDGFHVEIFNDHEIRFRRVVTAFNSKGFSCGDYERVTSDRLALRLFKGVGKIVIQYLHEEKPPYVYFTAGWDASRYSLYKALALRLKAHGYRLAYDDNAPNVYYAYRESKPVVFNTTRDD